MDANETRNDRSPGADLDELDATSAPGEAGRATPRFDPSRYLRRLPGRGGPSDYLDVKWRLRWLRDEHPAAEIVTDHVQIEPTLAIFKATVTLPTGGSATGYGSETKGDFGDFIEKAETKAIGRALNALGYGTADVEDDDGAPRDNQRPRAASPRPAPAAAERQLPPPPVELDATRTSRGGRDTTPRPTPAMETSGARVSGIQDQAASTGPRRAAAPVEPAPRASGPARSRPASEAPAAGDERRPKESGDDLADFSWTAFWSWARSLGINSREALDGTIGQSSAGLSPHELREMIRVARPGV